MVEAGRAIPENVGEGTIVSVGGNAESEKKKRLSDKLQKERTEYQKHKGRRWELEVISVRVMHSLLTMAGNQSISFILNFFTPNYSA
jgi:hypothetical protein